MFFFFLNHSCYTGTLSSGSLASAAQIYHPVPGSVCLLLKEKKQPLNHSPLKECCVMLPTNKREIKHAKHQYTLWQRLAGRRLKMFFNSISLLLLLFPKKCVSINSKAEIQTNNNIKPCQSIRYHTV